MVILDVPVVNIALPHAQADLHLTQSNRQWVITTYTPIFGGLLPQDVLPILVFRSDEEIVDPWKLMGSPVWELNGIICVGNIFTNKVKLVFIDGAAL